MPDSNPLTRSQPWVNRSEKLSAAGATEHDFTWLSSSGTARY